MLFQKDLPIEERISRGGRINLLALGRDEMSLFDHNSKYIVVSVTDPGKPEAEIRPTANLQGILRLKFDDIEKSNFVYDTSGDVLMSGEQAAEIWSFVMGNVDSAQLIVCQCEQGVSRSRAIAAALGTMLNGENEPCGDDYWLNRHVYRLMIENKPDGDFYEK